MKISEAQLYTALNEFIDREIIPLAANMDLTKQFMFGLKLGVVKRRLQSLVKNYISKPEMHLLALVDENGLIDIEPIYQSATDMLNKMQKLDIGGVVFKEGDLQNLYGIIQRYANQGVI